MTDINEIERLSAVYAEAMTALSQDVIVLDKSLRTVKEKALPGIKRAVQRAASAKTNLLAAVADSAELFQKPRTKVLHGVKVGIGKSKGKVVMADEELVIKRIRKLLPEEQAELLIRVKERVHKPGVYDLSVDDLKRLGIDIIGTGDQPVAKLMDSDIEKVINALLGDDSEEDDDAES